MFYNNQFLGVNVWSSSSVSCPSNIGSNSWFYYDLKQKKYLNVEDTLAVSCDSNESCCLGCTDFQNDSPPYCVMTWDMDVITENGKNIKYVDKLKIEML